MLFRFFDGPVKASQGLFASARTQIDHAVGHFERRINRVEVRIAKLASGRGGSRRGRHAHHGPLDKRCVIQATASGAGVIVVESSGEDFNSAINTAAEKLRRALERRLAHKVR